MQSQIVFGDWIQLNVLYYIPGTKGNMTGCGDLEFEPNETIQDTLSIRGLRKACDTSPYSNEFTVHLKPMREYEYIEISKNSNFAPPRQFLSGSAPNTNTVEPGYNDEH